MSPDTIYLLCRVSLIATMYVYHAMYIRTLYQDFAAYRHFNHFSVVTFAALTIHIGLQGYMTWILIAFAAGRWP